MSVLAWDAPVSRRFEPPGSLDPEALRMGRIVDYTTLQPGDLLLSRYERHDWVSDAIARVQAASEPDPEHHRFTHAMLYLGAGFVLEATFELKREGVRFGTTLRTMALVIGIEDIEEPLPTLIDPRNKLHGVFVTPLWHYGEGYSLRARRALALAGQPGRQQEMVANALSMCALDYDFELVRALGLGAVFPHNALPSEWSPQLRMAAVVCSTLYARAYDMTLLGEGLGAENGRCTPSFLCVNEAFQDIPLEWASVG